MTVNAARESSKCLWGNERSHHVQALCLFCDLPVVDIDKASGYIGKGSDPIIFPRCPHALHAECM